MFQIRGWTLWTGAEEVRTQISVDTCVNISTYQHQLNITYQHINISITGTMGGDGDGNEDILTLYVRRGAVSLLGSHLQTTVITLRLTYHYNSDLCYVTSYLSL